MSNVSIEHEAPLDVMRQRPEVILDLLHVARKEATSAAGVELIESELAETTPSVRRADLVAKVRDAHGAVVGIVVIEVQREKDEAKVRSWPLYVAHLATAYRAPVTLLVLTFDPTVARWARKRRHLGPNLSFAAIAIGPDDLPTINSIDDVLARRDLSVLTALVHLGRRRARTADRFAHEIAQVFQALRGAPEDPVHGIYVRLLHGVSRGKMRGMLEKLAEDDQMGALELIQEEEKAEARAAGRVEGRVEGKLEGKLEGVRDGLLRFLRARGFLIADPVRARIASSRDLSELERWCDRSATAATIDEVFTP